jgi:hypothetical protein
MRSNVVVRKPNDDELTELSLGSDRGFHGCHYGDFPPEGTIKCHVPLSPFSVPEPP